MNSSERRIRDGVRRPEPIAGLPTKRPTYVQTVRFHPTLWERLKVLFGFSLVADVVAFPERDPGRMSFAARMRTVSTTEDVKAGLADSIYRLMSGQRLNESDVQPLDTGTTG